VISACSALAMLAAIALRRFASLPTHGRHEAAAEYQPKRVRWRVMRGENANMGIKSPEEYREDARLVRALAAKATEEGARGPLLGMAELCEYLARRMDISRHQSYRIERPQSATALIAV